MKKLIFFLLLGCGMTSLFGQVSLGVSLAGAGHAAPGWERSMNTYNHVRPWQTNQLTAPRLAGGFQAQAAFGLSSHMSLLTTLGATRTGTYAENGAEEFDVAIWYFDAGVEAMFSSGTDKPTDGFFVSLGPHFAGVRGSTWKKWDSGEGAGFSGWGIGYGAGAHLGYGVRLSETVRLIPAIYAQYYLNATVSDFPAGFTGSNVTGLPEESQVILAGISIGILCDL
jgi:hypothetical protein